MQHGPGHDCRPRAFTRGCNSAADWPTQSVRVERCSSTPSRPLHLLYAANRRVTPKLRSFIDFAVGCFG
ncbi:hypothetical protein [Teichococcus rhizosphaerae]|uniref:hypothetical protein n=1 Tax=Teichococcus rhizosphaerae TaxID=1335062 RepID=UPI001C3F4A11